MSELSKKYKESMKKIDNKFQNEEELDFVKNEINDLVGSFKSEIDNLQKQVMELESKQNQMEDAMKNMASVLDSIEKDIYLDDEEDYDLEIVCPYCNYSFLLDQNQKNEEVQCPECKNFIEVDWNGDVQEFDGCNGNCGSCMRM